MINIFFLILLGSLGFTGCSKTADVPSKSVSTGKPQEIPKKGLVIFYREKVPNENSIRVLHYRESVVGTLKKGTTLYCYVDPGQQTFWSRVIAEDAVTVDIVAGQTYYIKGIAPMNYLENGTKLMVVTEAEANASVPNISSALKENKYRY